MSLVLGITGGALGLAVSQFLSFERQNFAMLSCGCEAVSLFRESEGGILLSSGAGLAALGWLFAIEQVASGGSFFALEIALSYFLAGFLWWDATILMAGLVAFPKTRRSLKRLRRDGWLP